MTHAAEPKEPENLPILRITVIGAIALAIFGGGVLWATAILERERRDRVERPAAQAGNAEVGIVNQWMYDLDHRAERLRVRERRRLTTYGWVDRNERRIHVPVEEAMKALAAERGPEDTR